VSKFRFKLVTEDDLKEVGIFIEKADGTPIEAHEYLEALQEYVNDCTEIIHDKSKGNPKLQARKDLH